MNIYINEEKVETQIVNERTLGDVYKAVSKWMQSQGHFVVLFLVDGKEVSSPEALFQLDINSASRMDFYSGGEIDILVSSLQELDKYIDTIGNTIFGRDSLTEKESKDLMEGSQWIREVLESAGTILKLDYQTIYPLKVGGNVTEVLSSIVTLSNNMDSTSAIEEYLDNLRNLKIFTIDLLNRVSAISIDLPTIKELIHTYSNNMETLKNEFIKVNETYQSGKDKVATQLLSHSLNRLHALVNGLIALRSKKNLDFDKFGISEEDFSSAIEKLNQTMNEVANSMEAGDIVQAGDLLEYELPSVLDGLVPILQKIASKL